MTEATVTLIKDMQFLAETGSGHTLVLDANPEAGGHDAGPRPVELLVAGTAGCTAMDVISILRKMRQDVTALEVRVVGERAQEHPKRLTTLHITYTVTGHGLDEQKVRQAINLSETKYCSAMASLRPGIPITSEYVIAEG